MPAEQIRYDLLVQEALRSVVRRVLSDAARDGLPGDHHFNISFRTTDEGVSIPPALAARYPEEMAIILQHEFWDLSVTDDQFQISLNFSRKPERLTIPFAAVTGFSDPSVPFGFKIESQGAETKPSQEPSKALASPPAAAPAPKQHEQVETAKKSTIPAQPAKPKPADKPPADAADAKIVSIDAFRKK